MIHARAKCVKRQTSVSSKANAKTDGRTRPIALPLPLTWSLQFRYFTWLPPTVRMWLIELFLLMTLNDLKR